MIQKSNNSVLYGVLAGVSIIIFFLLVVSIFQGFAFAILNLRSLWYWIILLSIGFGVQVGLYTTIRHTALANSLVSTSGVISGGSMIACCAHYIVNIIPVVGFASFASFLTRYQSWFFVLGIIANIIGIIVMIKHLRMMKGGIR
ncbi:hypothetical protein COU61_01855 [Candidatus Pacearchaeota archaeon CG10_big_fil_rev_8_21_14_0_10_35_13]|nr:MAG: hypothetical protein COU61_01855 [Candidatus Pacearchaeota archaeon CG10_big_fil_rev_8_21_14_0_10_35_13]